MKNISKRQKIIGFIAILLIAIISAIIVSTNVINKNVGSEGYSATTANANSNLVASYIKEGITIGGITGTLESLNTFDATATAEDIIWGETAYVKGEKITGTKVVTVAQAQEAQKVFEENTILLDDYGNSVKVPAGFKIADDSATAATGGVVIEDVNAGGENSTTIGSQFVWVPIGNVITDNDGNTTTIALGRYTFNTSTGEEHLVQSAENYASETLLEAGNYTDANYSHRELLKTTPSSNSKAKDLSDFVTKTLVSGGYYIGRYEAGDAYATDLARTGTDSVSNPNNPIVCKSGVYPYNYVNQADASRLCQEMYSNNNFESDLINSYSWDTAIVFIQEFSGDADYSQQRGINTVKKIQKCGESILDSSYIGEGDNPQDVRCNIYDIAGNVYEWSTETESNNNRPCVTRGGNYGYTGYYVSMRGNYNLTNTSNINDSARPILYL